MGGREDWAMRTDIKVTYEDYCTLPDGGPRYQVIDGDLVMSPSPTFQHQNITGRIYSALLQYVDAHSAGRVAIAPFDVVLSDVTVLQPDVLYVSKARQSIIRDAGIFGAPDLCVEVLSPNTRKFDTDIKRHLYARHGVIEYWIVDPESNTLTVYRLQDDAEKPTHTHDMNATLTSSLLPAFELSLSRLFAK
jgi:Uma2 family endonuclease